MATSTFTSNIEITINGTTIPRVNYLRINQRFESHHSFEISVSPSTLAGQSERLRNVADSFMGQRVAVRMSQTREGFPTQNNTFIGVVMSVKLVRGQSQNSSYLITGFGLSIFLAMGLGTRSYSEKTLSDIVNSTLSDDWVLNSPTYTTPIPYVTQYDEDRFHFLQRLADRYGEWFYYNGEKLIFGKNARPSTPTITLMHSRNFFDMEYGLRITPVKWKTSYFNYEEFQRFDADSAAEQVSGLSSLSQMMLDRSEQTFTDNGLNEIGYQDFVTEAALKQAVKVEKSERANQLAIISGRTPEMELKIGNLVSIVEPIYQNGEIVDRVEYGTFVITALYHSVDGSGVYQAYFEGIPQDTDMPPVNYNVIPRKATPQVAIVKDTADPLELGRVQLQMWWQGVRASEPDQLTPWVRVAMHMTGKSKSYFIPEVDDTVMVDFEYGNPDLPFVVGSLYANDAGPRKPGGELFRSDNHIKGIITRAQNHIIIDDTDGKEKIRIFNKEEKNLIELSLDGTHITIKSEGDINFEAGGNINMKAQKYDVTLKDMMRVNTEESVYISAQKEVAAYTETGGIFLDSKDKLNLKSAMGTEMTSDMSITVDGLDVSIDAKTNTNVKGSVQLNLEGGTVAALSGPMVKIN
ncbi:contractile injection system protein, VgrG/Pvc8 family [Runella sp. MFBS21]|uniref:type VI secretion system Vgr family protein n=1 Tax=Runella sp. MFBS21 TaxID=3034018 RepID=UPI0023F86EA3|nr:contractile injection system protein, VgrG/Pvc8 family [Runella sp. MFBS21]MDF7820366.1 contractile injection system protein, VgrG/Pvc8 family [Runella sp. MFBS21]